jgi:hypothetical protein
MFFDNAKSLASSGVRRYRALGMSLSTKVMA